MGKCASCHAGDMKSNSTGPALGGVQGRWEDAGKLHEWIRNNQKLIASGYPKAVEVSKISASAMTTFPDLTDPQIDAILAYIDAKASGKLDTPKEAAGGGAGCRWRRIEPEQPDVWSGFIDPCPGCPGADLCKL
ncbi:cytochrome c [Niabella defluvii]|nr:cytochrome c [Niabella sp. I65]